MMIRIGSRFAVPGVFCGDNRCRATRAVRAACYTAPPGEGRRDLNPQPPDPADPHQAARLLDGANRIWRGVPMLCRIELRPTLTLALSHCVPRKPGEIRTRALRISGNPHQSARREADVCCQARSFRRSATEPRASRGAQREGGRWGLNPCPRIHGPVLCPLSYGRHARHCCCLAHKAGGAIRRSTPGSRVCPWASDFTLRRPHMHLPSFTSLRSRKRLSRSG